MNKVLLGHRPRPQCTPPVVASLQREQRWVQTAAGPTGWFALLTSVALGKPHTQ